MKYVRKRPENRLKNNSMKSAFCKFFLWCLMDDTTLTTAHKVATDESADAICKVFPILALVCPSLTEQDGGENALRTKISSLFPKETKIWTKIIGFENWIGEPLLGKVGCLSWLTLMPFPWWKQRTRTSFFY